MATATAKKDDFSKYEQALRSSASNNNKIINIDVIKKNWAKVPKVRDLERRILTRINRCPNSFKMSNFHAMRDEHGDLEDLGHMPGDPDANNKPKVVNARLKKARTCGTTHCLAGWACVLGGDEGLKLEKRLGSADAGAAIFAKSVGYVPDFYQFNDHLAKERLRDRVVMMDKERAAKKQKKAK